MQTKHQIQELLRTAGVGPNTQLGQHFLIDLNLMRFLVDAASPQAEDIVLEVGCGTGSLTEELAQRAGRVVAVELDAALAAIAADRFEGMHNVTLIQGDILQNKHTFSQPVTDALAQAHSRLSGRLMLISNLPYGTAGPVIANLIAGEPPADCMYVTVQKEVAERMTAPPGTREYGPLSILLAATGRVTLLKKLKPTVFWPEPRVESAMISYLRDPARAERIKNIELFRQVIALFMQHRRKMAKACIRLAKGRLEAVKHWDHILDKSGVRARVRPEQIEPEAFVKIANLCYEQFRSGQKAQCTGKGQR